MAAKMLSDSDRTDLRRAMATLISAAADAKVAYDPAVAATINRAWAAVREERDPPVVLAPTHKLRNSIALPPGLRAVINDEIASGRF
jgi:hypothetical protein